VQDDVHPLRVQGPLRLLSGRPHAKPQVVGLIRELPNGVQARGLPQRTLAAMLGVQWPSLDKVLKDLERDGLIRIGYSEIDILDPAGLARRGQ
jgi:hypothetical protein